MGVFKSYKKVRRTHGCLYKTFLDTSSGFVITKATAICNQDSSLKMAMASVKVVYHCDQCDNKYPDASGLGQHKQEAHEVKKPYRCEQCGKTYSHFSSLAWHRNTHVMDKLFKCDQCGQGFKTAKLLAVHRKKHAVEKPYKCGMCEKHFMSEGHLCHHMNLHTGERPYRCGICDIGFHNVVALSNHKRSHKLKNRHECEVCKSVFFTLSEFVQHRKLHTGGKPYKCYCCEKSFISSEELLGHSKTHSFQGVLHCDYCDITFAQSYDLVVHMRIHKDLKKNYPCGTCNKIFLTPTHLANHKRTHIRVCKRCNKSFPDSSNLIAHSKTHMGQYMYSCDECSQTFTTSTALTLHKQCTHKKKLLNAVLKEEISTQKPQQTIRWVVADGYSDNVKGQEKSRTTNGQHVSFKTEPEEMYIGKDVCSSSLYETSVANPGLFVAKGLEEMSSTMNNKSDIYSTNGMNLNTTSSASLHVKEEPVVLGTKYSDSVIYSSSGIHLNETNSTNACLHVKEELEEVPFSIDEKCFL